MGNSSLRLLLMLGMVISIVLSIAFLLIGFLTKTPPAKYQDITIGLLNALVLVVGILRVRNTTDISQFGRMASQHLWIVFSLSTAALSLVFGSYFYPGSVVLHISTVAILSIVSLVTLIAVLGAATRRVPIFD